MVAPKTTANPDTYLGTYYACPPSTPHSFHAQSTIVSHWSYLPATGENGDRVNDNSCDYDVQPPAATADKAFEQALATMFYASTQYLTDNPSFDDIRAATVRAAQDVGDDAL